MSDHHNSAAPKYMFMKQLVTQYGTQILSFRFAPSTMLYIYSSARIKKLTGGVVPTPQSLDNDKQVDKAFQQRDFGTHLHQNCDQDHKMLRRYYFTTHPSLFCQILLTVDYQYIDFLKSLVSVYAKAITTNGLLETGVMILC